MKVILRKALTALSHGVNLYSKTEQQQWFNWMNKYDYMASLDPPVTEDNLFTCLIPKQQQELLQKRSNLPSPNMEIRTRVPVPCYVIQKGRFVIIHPHKVEGI